MQDYDVVIVGGGPGGLSCARHLSNSGLKILVLEKNNTLGKKICSGEVSSKTFPGVKFKNEQKWETVVVGTHKGTVPVSYNRPFLWTVGRFELETFLKNNSDAVIHFSEPVVEITPDYVVTSKAKYKYKFLVGADGSFSRVRDYLKLPMKHIVGWAFHFIIDKPADRFAVYWLPNTFPKGYGYVMSKSLGKTMIGGAMVERSDNSKESVHQVLAPKVKEWVAKEFGLDVNKLKSEGMKGNADYRGWKFNNVFLVGDAAGLLNPLTTEGIFYAVKSGEGVAKFIRRDPEGQKIMNSMQNAHRWQVLIFDIATAWPFCWLVHWILSNPKGWLRSKIFNYVFWKFMDG
ncbi:Digeranylgeranylglycerophospholipid reductase [Candidatus Bilamarchaeum dharawalense]|uniref:Digeranylgeranylglycerophospholipid reductase n=1 Tax=Candidatus Bilamarchaeum dharawalense TaxID=2885759 RepID=A0A5E4LQP4_9ARCH|nr:Digeranylgeranylglycerophospholipid reductase [Candidatus Bilamarchaeum dharawalense]